jgi:1-acyl-sn-glycerol-3-phosphate acyltransferase
MLRGIWLRCVLIVATVLVATPVFVALLILPRWGDLLIHGGRLWSRILLAAAGARVRFHGHDRVRQHDPCIFIANHQSMVDVWVMLTLVPPNTRFVAKQELFRIPVFGWVLARSGCIAIDRGKRSVAIRSLRQAGERIRAGRSVVLYPEGSRSLDGRLGPFKKGAFHLALSAAVPVVPVAITGSFEVMPPRSLRVRPGPVEVFIEPPVDVGPFRPDDHDGLRAAVHRTIGRRFGDPGGEPEPSAVPQEGA